jgi:hypothetical protein
MNVKKISISFVAFSLMFFSSLLAQKQKNAKELPDFVGLSVFIDAGCSLPNDYTAAFYNGTNGNQNTIDRILHSQMYGNEIWANLVDLGLISPSAIPNYMALQVVENAKTEYDLALQLGLGFRYDFVKRFGMMARFDYSKLTVRGMFNISAGAPSSILTNKNQYIPCGIYGSETRTYIDLGLFKSFYLADSWRLVLDFGLNLNSTNVLTNAMEIGGKEYSILDVWNGNSPNMGMQSYDYYQSGVGYGFFVTPNLEYIFSNSMGVDFGFSFYYTKINIPGYEAFKPQYVFYIRFLTNKF